MLTLGLQNTPHFLHSFDRVSSPLHSLPFNCIHACQIFYLYHCMCRKHFGKYSLRATPIFKNSLKPTTFSHYTQQQTTMGLSMSSESQQNPAGRLYGSWRNSSRGLSASIGSFVCISSSVTYIPNMPNLHNTFSKNEGVTKYKTYDNTMLQNTICQMLTPK